MIDRPWGANIRLGRVPSGLAAIALAVAIAGSAGLVGLAVDLASSGALGGGAPEIGGQADVSGGYSSGTH